MGITPNGYRAMHQSIWTTIVVAYFQHEFEYWSSYRLFASTRDNSKR
jgi:hypothetical protein